MNPIRLLKAKQMNILNQCYEENKEHLVYKEGSAIFWMHIYLNDQFLVKNPNQEEAHTWVCDIVKEVLGEEMIHINYGFVFSPKNSTKNQQYHIDYHETMHTILITMAYHTSENSTQYVTSKINVAPYEGPYGLTRYGKDDKELLERSGCDSIQISQTICKPYMILHIPDQGIHRGIANRTNEDRPLFIINCSKQKVIIKEESLVVGYNYQTK